MSTQITTPLARSRNGLLAVLGLLALGGAFFWGRSTGGRAAAPTQVAQGGAHDEAGHEERDGERGEEGHGEEGLVKFGEGALELANLRVEPVRETALPSRLAVTGQVEADPASTVRVTPRVDGKVTKLFANVGDVVRAGQVLAVVESERLHEAQVAHRLALKRVELARGVLARRRRLAALGEYGRPGVEQARSRLTETEREARGAQNEVGAAQAAVSQAQAQVRGAQAALKQAQTGQGVAEARAARAEALFKEELLSRQDLEQARADAQRALADVEAARAAVGQAGAGVEGADARLSAARATLDAARKQREIAAQALGRAEAVYRGGYNTSKEVAEAESAHQQALIEAEGALDDVRLLGGRPGDLHEIPVKAPIAGRVTERAGSLGQTVAAGTPILTLLNSQTVWVQLNVSQKDLAGVRVGQAVAVTSDAAPGATFRGTVSSVGATVDEETRTVKVRAVIQNAGGRLRPGVFVSGSVVGSGADGGRGIAVPQDAVQELEGKQVVFVAGDHEGEFKAQPVEVGGATQGRVEIRSGLKSGDRIVTKNAFTVKAQAMKAELGEGHAH